MSAKFLLAALALTVCAAPAAAQARMIVPGDEVRVVAPSVRPGTLRGEVVLYQGDTLALRDRETGARIAIPLDSVRRLSRNEGTNRGRSAWHGGRFGLFLGATLGALAGPFLAKDQGDENMGRAALLGGLGGGAVGLGVGSAAGAVFARDHWQAYRMPVRQNASVTLDFRDGAAVGVSLSIR